METIRLEGGPLSGRYGKVPLKAGRIDLAADLSNKEITEISEASVYDQLDVRVRRHVYLRKNESTFAYSHDTLTVPREEVSNSH